MPVKVTREMIKQGVMNSSDMMCFPYKATLGQQIWCLENGAEELIMWDNHGLCRQKHYFDLQRLTLENLGYHFKIHAITAENGLTKAVELTGLPLLDLIKAAKEFYNELLEIEKRIYQGGGNEIKVGIIGEIYTILEPDINLDIIKKLQRMDVTVHVSVKLSDFIKHNWLSQQEHLEEQAEAKKLLGQEIGGHGFHSIYNTIWYGKNNYDGVIHLMPLSCMPECTIEPIVDHIANKYNIPLYRFPIDENNFEAGVQTRLETFVSMLKRRRQSGKWKIT